MGGGLPYQEVAQRWSGQVHRMAVWGPPVDQDLDGPRGRAQPDGMEPLEAASDRGGGEGGILAQEVTLAAKI